MPARLAAVAITAFWLVMMTLLVRVEYFPRGSSLAAVPPEHVWRLMFAYRQPSFLSIFASNRRAGSASLRPDVAARGERRLDFSGTFALARNTPARDRIFWSGTLALDRDFEVSHLVLTASLNNPPWRVEVDYDRAQEKTAYRVMDGGEVVQQFSGKTSDLLAAVLQTPELQPLGLNPAALLGWQSQLGPSAVRIVRDHTQLHHEDVPGYTITVQQGGQLSTKIFVSQLGQVLTVDTPFGINLSADEP